MRRRVPPALDKGKSMIWKEGNRGEIYFGKGLSVNKSMPSPKKFRMVFKICFFFLILPVFIQPHEAFAELKLAAKDKQRLSGYINTYDSEKLVADSMVKPKVEKLLGQEFNHLKKNIEVHGPIGVDSGILFVSGNAPHKGGLEHGFVGINLYDGEVYAALFTDGKIKVYGKETECSRLPDGVRHWILMTWAYINLDGSTPPNLELRPSK
jgi:hypothetical protein